MRDGKPNAEKVNKLGDNAAFQHDDVLTLASVQKEVDDRIDPVATNLKGPTDIPTNFPMREGILYKKSSDNELQDGELEDSPSPPRSTRRTLGDKSDLKELWGQASQAHPPPPKNLRNRSRRNRSRE